MSGTFEGQVAVVTGGASGIGEACARTLAARGARIVIIDVAEERARKVAADIDATVHLASVNDADAMEALAERIEAETGPVDVVVTSAGVGQAPLPPEELSMEVWDRMVDIDLRGTYISCLVFGKRMALRGRGAIITIASITGMRATPLHGYAPAKAAVINLTQGLAAEWGRSGVRLNAVSPGYTLTPLLKRAIDRGTRDPALMEQNSALGRMVEPDEIAKAVAFLASDEAAAITGINLPVDAGWLTAGSYQTYGGVRPPRVRRND